MDLQTIIAYIVVAAAVAVVLRTFVLQFTSRDHKGCSSCTHGGGAVAQDGQLIQVESASE